MKWKWNEINKKKNQLNIVLHTLDFLRQTLICCVCVCLSRFLSIILLLLIATGAAFVVVVDTSIQRRLFYTNIVLSAFFRHTRCNIATNRRWRVLQSDRNEIQKEKRNKNQLLPSDWDRCYKNVLVCVCVRLFFGWEFMGVYSLFMFGRFFYSSLFLFWLG